MAHHPGLDGLRGLAFLGVLLFHDAWLGIGWVGVPLFFVVSGVLIRGSLERTAPDAPAGARLRQFATKRFARLAPLYLLWVGLALAYRLATGVPTPPLSVVGLLTGTFNWTRALAPVDDPSITHLWSLSAEEQCYALAALGAVAVAARLRAHAWALAIAATTAARVALWLALADADPYLRADAVYQLSQVDLFLVGAAVASAPEAAARWRWPVTVACAGALGAHALLIEPTTWWELTSLGLPFAGHVNLQPLWSLPLLAVLLAPWVAAAIVRPPWLLRRPALQHLGRRCYALYVLHWAVLTGLDAALGVDHPTELPLALGVAKLAFSLVSLALLAEISWRGLEAPVGRWIRDRLITAG